MLPVHDLRMPGSGMRFAFEGLSPVVADDAWIAPTAVLIGDVHVGPGSSVWYGCVIRGDTNRIRIGARCNIQDNTVIHVNHDFYPTLIGDEVTVGHAAIVHACELHDRAFVGMGAAVMDGAVIEEGGVLGAAALLPPGRRIGKFELWTGSPARLKRVLTPDARAAFDETAEHYVELAQRHRAGLRRV